MTLHEYLNLHGIALRDFAREIGVFDGRTVQRYATGSRLPRPEVMERIAKATKGEVTASDFYAGSKQNLCRPEIRA